jgi:hypothetical protein
MFHLRGTYAVTEERSEPVPLEVLKRKKQLALNPDLDSFKHTKTVIKELKIRSAMKQAIIDSGLFFDTDKMFDKLQKTATKVYTKPKVYNALSGGEVGCLSCKNRILKGVYLDIFKEFLKKE